LDPNVYLFIISLAENLIRSGNYDFLIYILFVCKPVTRGLLYCNFLSVAQVRSEVSFFVCDRCCTFEHIFVFVGKKFCFLRESIILLWRNWTTG
ncbi:hypothetical protein, partial [Salmonella sp. s51944]|uniref:hypothetical protein n=1 Tax=Salmonella sp. s51944 TaxID=3159655 RepID=UPI003980A686